MEQIEFKLTTDIQRSIPHELSFNYEEIRGWLIENLAGYKKMAVTKDSILDAKAARAKVNNLSKSISEYRVQVKRQYMVPFEDFERKAKELSAICAETSSVLDTQIKEIEDKEKDMKIQDLRNFFNQNVGDSAPYIVFERIYNPKWANKTFSIEDARKEILTQIGKCVIDIGAIRGLKSPYEAALLDEYVETGNVAACVQKNAKLIQIAQTERQEEKKQAKAEEDDDVQRQNEAIFKITFTAMGTKNQLTGLANYMRAAKIPYKRAEKN